MATNVNDQFIQFLRNKVQSNREDAGFNGRHDDGGARVLEDQIEVYKAGLKNIMPLVWQPYIVEFVKSTDPEYAEFKRLKAKFRE